VVEIQPGNAPYLHRTDSLDYVICLQGEVEMQLDDGASVKLAAGDVLVQRGTNHAWLNRGSAPCRLAVVLIDGKPLQSSGKAQRKPLELLMALVAFGGRDVSESQLTETLWPDAEGDAAHEACAITLHRLRKLLGHDQAISLQRNHFSLDPCYVWVDVWAFERWLAPAQGDAAGRRASEKAIALYQGPFLGKHADLSWALLLRERLRSKFLRHLVQWSRGLFEAKEFEAAVVVLEKGLNVDPLAEEFYRDLMLCYQALGRRAEATGVYQRCQKILGAVLGVSPAPETVALYQSFHR